MFSISLSLSLTLIYDSHSSVQSFGNLGKAPAIAPGSCQVRSIRPAKHGRKHGPLHEQVVVMRAKNGISKQRRLDGLGLADEASSQSHALTPLYD